MEQPPFPDEWVPIDGSRLNNRQAASDEDVVTDEILIARIHLRDCAIAGSESPKTLGIIARMITALEATLAQIHSADVFFDGDSYLTAVEVKGLLHELRAALDSSH